MVQVRDPSPGGLCHIIKCLSCTNDAFLLFSGKSTLANILLRIFDFDPSLSPEKPSRLFINGVDIRRYDPDDYHRHVTALFQTFSKLNATVRENVGIGDVGSQFSDHVIREAAIRGGASKLLKSLPRGLDTNLESMGFGMSAFGDNSFTAVETENERQGLSGGEVCTACRNSNDLT